MKSLIIWLVVCFWAWPVLANNLPDADADGVPDEDEIKIYKTDPAKFDSDNDSYGDGEELRNGYSPLSSKRIKLEDSDYDNDGLSDRMELNFQTDLTNPDTDGDGYKDGEEIKAGYNPKTAGGVKLSKRIEVNTKKQELSYFLDGVRMDTFKVSTGKAAMPTPRGHFTIDEKELKAWSKPYKLWMPYWLSLAKGTFGIHELPIWPSGKREGANHLGGPASHGCIRLGIGPAKLIYDWAEIGTLVVIY